MGCPLRAWDGYPPLRGEAFPQAGGPDLSSGQFADWDTVDSGSEEQANVFSPNTVSTKVGSRALTTNHPELPSVGRH